MDYLTLRCREFDTTLRVLQAYPESEAQMKPADKSKTAAQLMMTLVNEERVITALLETAIASPVAWRREAFPSLAATIAAWEQAASANTAAVAKLSSEDFKKTVDFYGRPMLLGDALWLELLDHIHHRGQLSVYLRVAGAIVPSIYGPTAETPMPQAG
jgi:uncharacterized damage-inducible protein DinB